MNSAKAITLSHYSRHSCSIQIHGYVPHINGRGKVISYNKWRKFKKQDTVKGIFIYVKISLNIQSSYNIQSTDIY